jgi:hypothetical protein
VPLLQKIAQRRQIWADVAAVHGVANPVPPWKTSLDGLCDALDHAAEGTGTPGFKARRDEEDVLSATAYSTLPYPENQLMSLAHSLLVRGVIDEAELEHRLDSVRARLEA